MANEEGDDKSAPDESETVEAGRVPVRVSDPDDLDRVFVIIPGRVPDALANGTFGSYENTIDRVMKFLPKGVRLDNVRVYVVGYPYGLGGNVTPEWIEVVQRYGFSAYGPALAPFFEGLAHDTGRVIVNGH